MGRGKLYRESVTLIEARFTLPLAPLWVSAVEHTRIPALARIVQRRSFSVYKFFVRM
jgi:hypothetical protein